VAENLWALREKKKLSVAALANRSGLPIGLIMEYESGLRSIDPRHLGRLARALYVEETDIKLQSDPRPGSGPLERQPRREVPGRVPAEGSAAGRPPSADPGPRARPPRPRPEPKPPGPARPSQIVHLENMLKRLGRSKEDLEAELGRPIAELDRVAMSELLKTVQAQIGQSDSATRRRARLPESVDEHEARYLTAAQEGGDRLHFTLFDGSYLDGQVIGFGPFNITVRQADGTEISVNKLAVVHYRRDPAAGAPKEPSA